MAESTQSIFLKIARETGALTGEQIEEILGLQALDRMRGRTRSVEKLSVKEGFLNLTQAKKILHAVRYYVVRKADKRYAKVALKLGFVDRATIDEARRCQRAAFRRHRLLTRLGRILLEGEMISREQDERVRVGVREALDSELVSRRRSGSGESVLFRSCELAHRTASARISARHVAVPA